MKITDALGTELKSGQNVIYNHSGTLAYGVIFKVVYKERIACCTNRVVFAGFIDIALIEPKTYRAPKHGISRIRNPASIIVLQKELFNESARN